MNEDLPESLQLKILVNTIWEHMDTRGFRTSERMLVAHNIFVEEIARLTGGERATISNDLASLISAYIDPRMPLSITEQST